MQKVLAVHGRGSDITKASWKRRKEIFKKAGMILDVHQFDKAKDPSYESWKVTFDKIDVSKYDFVYTSSLGGVMTCRYLDEKRIKLKRLVMVVPGKSFKTQKGLNPNVEKIWDYFEQNGFDLLVDEIIVMHAKDDEVVPFENAKDFAGKLGAKFIALENGGHNLDNYELIIKLVKEGIIN